MEIIEYKRPLWDKLWEYIESQCGVFTIAQARAAGFSTALVHRHITNFNFVSIHPGIYRLTRFPTSAREGEEYVIAWLWSKQQGIISHETALQLHQLGNIMPTTIHITLPTSQKRRKPYKGLSTQYVADLAQVNYQWIGSVPVTSIVQTINDVAAMHGDIDNLDECIVQAIKQNKARPHELLPAITYIANFYRSADVKELEAKEVQKLKDRLAAQEFPPGSGKSLVTQLNKLLENLE